MKWDELLLAALLAAGFCYLIVYAIDNAIPPVYGG